MTRRGRPSRDVIYGRLDTQIAELWQRMGGLPHPSEAEDIWTGIWYEEVHNSTAIEGNTLVLKQVEVLLSEGRAVGNKELGEYLEVKGYADAAAWVYRQAISPELVGDDAITLTEVRRIHEMAMTPVWDAAPHPAASAEERPGGFRRHDIRPFAVGMKPPSWVQVEAEMAFWIQAARSVRPRSHRFPETIAQLHCRFEQIHPFLDGNGRVGRLVLNLLLIRLGYPPAVFYKRDRKRYIGALRRGDSGDFGALGELLARTILDNLHRFVVPAVAGPARLVPLAALAGNKISAAALRVAASRGRLQAVRGPDGLWRSTPKWVEAYFKSRYARL